MFPARVWLRGPQHIQPTDARVGGEDRQTGAEKQTGQVRGDVRRRGRGLRAIECGASQEPASASVQVGVQGSLGDHRLIFPFKSLIVVRVKGEQGLLLGLKQSLDRGGGEGGWVS